MLLGELWLGKTYPREGRQSLLVVFKKYRHESLLILANSNDTFNIPNKP